MSKEVSKSVIVNTSLACSDSYQTQCISVLMWLRQKVSFCHKNMKTLKGDTEALLRQQFNPISNQLLWSLWHPSTDFGQDEATLVPVCCAALADCPCHSYTTSTTQLLILKVPVLELQLHTLLCIRHIFRGTKRKVKDLEITSIFPFRQVKISQLQHQEDDTYRL